MATVVRGLLASPLAERYELHTITTHRLGSRAARSVVAARGLVELAVWCRRHPDGAVHIHSAVRGSLYRKAAAVLLARSLRRPVLLQVHAGPGDIRAFAIKLGHWRRAILGLALRRAQVVLSVSAASAEALRETFGPVPVGVIHNAVAPPSGGVGDPEGSVVLYLGGFANPVKGGDVLVRALPRLLARAPDARVVMAGPGKPPHALVSLLGESVQWRGWLDEDEKRKALAEAAIFVLPSTSEGLPMALLEAMSFGRGIVATDVGGVPDTIADGVEGLLVPPGDEIALANALIALARDPQRTRDLGAAARCRAAAFAIDAVVDQLDALYEELLAR